MFSKVKTTKALGDEAEDLACRYLQERGLKLIARNVRGPRGELDLIMTEGQTLVFVEVRSRRPSRFGSGADSIDHNKQQKLLTTALYYLQQHPKRSQQPARFDVISIRKLERGADIDWIKDAFQA